MLLMEALVSGGCLRKNGRVVAVSSEGVRARRPAGGRVEWILKAEISFELMADKLPLKAPFTQQLKLRSSAL